MTQITPCVIHSSVVRQMKDNCEKQMTPVFGTQTSLPDLSNSVTVFSVPTHTLTPPHKSTKEGRKHLNMNLTCLYIHIFHIYMYIISTYFTKHTPPWSDRQCTEPSSRLPQERWKQPPMKGFSGVIWAIHILRRMHWMTTSYFPLQVADPVATMPRPTTATASRVVCRNEFKWVQKCEYVLEDSMSSGKAAAVNSIEYTFDETPFYSEANEYQTIPPSDYPTRIQVWQGTSLCTNTRTTLFFWWSLRYFTFGPVINCKRMYGMKQSNLGNVQSNHQCTKEAITSILLEFKQARESFLRSPLCFFKMSTSRTRTPISENHKLRIDYVLKTHPV